METMEQLQAEYEEYMAEYEEWACSWEVPLTFEEFVALTE